MNFFSLLYGYYILNIFKIFGFYSGLSDDYLAIVGSVGAIASCIFRFIWGYLADYYSYKSLYAYLLVLQFISCTLLYQFKESPVGFLILYCVSYICYSGHFSLVPLICSSIFGVKKGLKVYSTLNFVFSLSALVGGILVMSFLEKVGFHFFFNGLGLVTSLSFLILQFFSTKKYEDSLSQENLRVK